MNDSDILTAVYSFPIQLTENTWADGYFPTSSDVQWFKFTATAGTQYIYYSGFLSLQVNDSSGATVGSLDMMSSGSVAVTVGQDYYIRVQSSFGFIGTYRIAFSASSDVSSIKTTLPSGAIQLVVNTWADGNFPTSSDVQWFKFTATAGTQYIHFNPGSLRDVYVWVNDSSGATVDDKLLQSSFSSVSSSVTVGQEYYIRICVPYGYNSYRIGTYGIAFNASSTAPTP